MSSTEIDSPNTSVDSFLRACESCWPVDQARPRVVVRAPGRLDCMGGMADFSGTLALQMPIARAVYLAAGRRNDQRIHIDSIGWENNGEHSCFEWPLDWFYQSDGEFITPSVLASRLESCPWSRHAAGVCLALLESGEIAHLGGGATLVYQSDIPPGAGLASSAALQVATAKALACLFEADLDAHHLARACRTADVEVVGAEPGLVDHLACLLGEANALLQIRCQPDDVLGPLPLPGGVVLVAVDAGLQAAIRRQRYADNRMASAIGKFLIEQMLKASGEPGDPIGGYLANISPAEYVSRFRNNLPVKLRGRDFIDRHGQALACPDESRSAGMLDPDQVYKVRSRTEHHIYENDRSHRFMERLSRARRTGERDALVEAGELMYASHWSYSQRCGMGSIETDVLANAIRSQGAGRGLYGAKVTGMGCGGTVAVLMSDQPGAWSALEEARTAYARKTGKTAVIHAGSSPGAMSFGHFRIEN